MVRPNVRKNAEFLSTLALMYASRPALVNGVRRAVQSNDRPNIPAMRAAILKLLNANRNLNKTAKLLKLWRQYEAAAAKPANRLTGQKRKRPNAGARPTRITNLPEHVVMRHIASKMNHHSKAMFAVAVPHFKELRENMNKRKALVQEVRDLAYVCARMMRNAGTVVRYRLNRALPLAQKLAEQYGFKLTSVGTGSYGFEGKFMKAHVQTFGKFLDMHDIGSQGEYISLYAQPAGTRWKLESSSRLPQIRLAGEAARQGIADAYRMDVSSVAYTHSKTNYSNSNSNN